MGPLLTAYGVAGALCFMILSDYVSWGGEPVSVDPDESVTVAVHCRGIVVPDEYGACEKLQLFCLYPDGNVVETNQVCNQND